MLRFFPHGKRFAEEEMDEDGTLEREGNPHARPPRPRRRAPRIPRWAYRAALALLLCILGMLLWFNRENLAPQNVVDWVQSLVVGIGVGDGYPVAVAGSAVSTGNFQSAGGDLVYVSDTRILALNSTAHEIVSRQHSYGSPVLRTAGNRMLVFDLGGRGWRVETQTRLLSSGENETDLLAGDIAANGRWALVSEEEGYAGQLRVYQPDGTELYHFSFADFYITSVALNRDGTRAVACGVSAQEGALLSAAYLFDFSQPDPVARELYEGTVLLRAFYNEDGTVFLVGETMAGLLREDGSGRVDVPYGARQLADFDASGGRLALGFAPFEGAGSGSVSVLDSTGALVRDLSFQDPVDSVSLSGDVVGVLSGGAVSAWAVTTGQAYGSFGAGNDARAAVLANEGGAYVLGINEIRAGTFS